MAPFAYLKQIDMSEQVKRIETPFSFLSYTGMKNWSCNLYT